MKFLNVNAIPALESIKEDLEGNDNVAVEYTGEVTHDDLVTHASDIAQLAAEVTAHGDSLTHLDEIASLTVSDAKEMITEAAVRVDNALTEVISQEELKHAGLFLRVSTEAANDSLAKRAGIALKNFMIELYRKLEALIKRLFGGFKNMRKRLNDLKQRLKAVDSSAHSDAKIKLTRAELFSDGGKLNTATFVDQITQSPRVINELSHFCIDAIASVDKDGHYELFKQLDGEWPGGYTIDTKVYDTHSAQSFKFYQLRKAYDAHGIGEDSVECAKHHDLEDCLDDIGNALDAIDKGSAAFSSHVKNAAMEQNSASSFKAFRTREGLGVAASQLFSQYTSVAFIFFTASLKAIEHMIVELEKQKA